MERRLRSAVSQDRFHRTDVLPSFHAAVPFVIARHRPIEAAMWLHFVY
jgi:hypothetical protein